MAGRRKINRSVKNVRYSLKDIALKFSNDLDDRCTKYEARAIKLLEYLKIRYRFQHPVDNGKNSFYVLDFYLPTKRVCIEIDGGYHKTSKQIIKDVERDAYLNSINIGVFRIANEDIWRMGKGRLRKLIHKNSPRINKKLFTNVAPPAH